LEERISKILSAHGLCSRRRAEEWIQAGRVTVNGACAVLGQKADAARDEICVDGEPLRRADAPCYVMLHKPRGYVTTVSDEKGRRTVMELVADVPVRVWPVGRLDMDSEGLLLLTNDGTLTDALLHPRHAVPKTYQVWVAGDLSAVAQLRRLRQIDGQAIGRAQVRLLKPTEGGGVLSITIGEGKNRQIRRMCQAVGLTVLRLKRVREGALSLGSLPKGKWRALTEEEVAALKGEGT
jgi:23S rRNA pseudouridine2605 synthase